MPQNSEEAYSLANYNDAAMELESLVLEMVSLPSLQKEKAKTGS